MVKVILLFGVSTLMLICLIVGDGLFDVDAIDLIV